MIFSDIMISETKRTIEKRSAHLTTCRTLSSYFSQIIKVSLERHTSLSYIVELAVINSLIAGKTVSTVVACVAIIRTNLTSVSSRVRVESLQTGGIAKIVCSEKVALSAIVAVSETIATETSFWAFHSQCNIGLKVS